MAPVIHTVREKIFWSYANLARAHAALSDGATTYNRTHHIIRTKLFNGLLSGKLSMRSLYDDERIKLRSEAACAYCGSRRHLSVDHLIPRIKGGPDDADNLILACRSCNSSKQGKDMLQWMCAKNCFASILLLRRYIKIVARHCEREGVMDLELKAIGEAMLPFEIDMLPENFPPLSELRLWVNAEALRTDVVAQSAGLECSGHEPESDGRTRSVGR